MTSTTAFHFQMNTDELVAVIKQRAQRNVKKATLHLRNELVEKVNNVGDGNEYPIRPETGRIETVEITNKLGRKQKVRKLVGARMHKASRPGEAPAVLRAQLKTSFHTEFISDGDLLKGIVGPRGVPYAKALEFGFVGKDKNGRNHNLQPRPYMYPTFHAEREIVKAILREGLDR